MAPGRTFAWDWYPGAVPENVVIDETAYVETAFSFFSDSRWTYALCASAFQSNVSVITIVSPYAAACSSLGFSRQLSGDKLMSSAVKRWSVAAACRRTKGSVCSSRSIKSGMSHTGARSAVNAIAALRRAGSFSASGD